MVERERTIVVIEAGYLANCKLIPDYPLEVARDDREKEIALLDEIHPDGAWSETDQKLTAEALGLVERHWRAVEQVAAAIS
jgi:hypothetical protein